MMSPDITHELFRERMSEWIDGMLRESDAAKMIAHSAGCDECREIESSLRSIVLQLHELPIEIEPRAGTWESIAAAVHALPECRPVPVRSRIPKALALAAVIVLAVSIPIAMRDFALFSSHAPGSGYAPAGTHAPGRAAIAGIDSSAAATTAATTAAATATATAPAVVRRALPPVLVATDQALSDAQAALDQVLASRRSQLSPVTLRVIEENLLAMQQATERIRDALALDPSNRSLQQMLVASHRRQLSVMKDVTLIAARQDRTPHEEILQ